MGDWNQKSKSHFINFDERKTTCACVSNGQRIRQKFKDKGLGKEEMESGHSTGCHRMTKKPETDLQSL